MLLSGLDIIRIGGSFGSNLNPCDPCLLDAMAPQSFFHLFSKRNVAIETDYDNDCPSVFVLWSRHLDASSAATPHRLTPLIATMFHRNTCMTVSNGRDPVAPVRTESTCHRLTGCISIFHTMQDASDILASRCVGLVQPHRTLSRNHRDRILRNESPS